LNVGSKGVVQFSFAVEGVEKKESGSRFLEPNVREKS